MRRFLVLGAIAGLWIMAGCGGTPTDKGKLTKYTLNGLAELNLDDGKDYLYLKFTSDGKGVPGSFIRIGNDTLFFDGSGIINVSTPEVLWGFNENVVITLQDTAAGFVRTIVAQMPGDLSITSFVPDTRIYQSGNVLLEWNPASGAAGYFVTCVERQSGGEARGFADFVGTGATAATIGPSAFENRLYPNQPRVTGLFYVYVVAYKPSFYPRPGPKYLDTPEFGNLEFPASALGADLSGTFGTAVVSEHDSVEVIAQP